VHTHDKYEEVTDFMNEMIKHQANHGFSSGDIFEKETDTFVGRGGLIYLEMKDDQPDVEIGYILHKQFWGKGYATELARTFLDWGFNNLPVERILASVLPENKNSRHVVEKIGMNYIGNRKCWGNESAVYEILKT
jgi:ribosomal-protein-alanine N-acetyltransferase